MNVNRSKYVLLTSVTTRNMFPKTLNIKCTMKLNVNAVYWMICFTVIAIGKFYFISILFM